ncbi:MAG: transcriptional repressor NrdR [Ruminococcaceae bacterium]|nr:transcriptional repressor NrdR [Oscillospiraceae bacterium]
MKCPNCGHTKSNVIDSRPTENSSIRRRRECENCGKRFTTYEIIDTVPVFIVKKDGKREVYDRNKMMAGMVKACYKRPVTDEQLNKAADEIEQELQNSLKSEFSSTEMGNFVMEKLRALDEVSYVRFASVYREFKDIETFMTELKEIIKANKKAAKKSEK